MKKDERKALISPHPSVNKSQNRFRVLPDEVDNDEEEINDANISDDSIVIAKRLKKLRKGKKPKFSEEENLSESLSTSSNSTNETTSADEEEFENENKLAKPTDKECELVNCGELKPFL